MLLYTGEYNLPLQSNYDQPPPIFLREEHGEVDIHKRGMKLRKMVEVENKVCQSLRKLRGTR